LTGAIAPMPGFVLISSPIGPLTTANPVAELVVLPRGLTPVAALARVSDRIGRAKVILPATAVTALASLTLALPLTPTSMMTAALLQATGSAVLDPTLAAAVVDRAPDGERGLALVARSAAWDLGVVVGSVRVFCREATQTGLRDVVMVV
jgi:MFS family permease